MNTTFFDLALISTLLYDIKFLNYRIPFFFKNMENTVLNRYVLIFEKISNIDIQQNMKEIGMIAMFINTIMFLQRIWIQKL